MAEQVFLGVDLGAESGRVMAARLGGGQVTLEELHRFPNRHVRLGDTLRWDPLALWAEIESGLTKAAVDFGGNIRSVGVDTWGVDYALLSEHGELLGAPYHHRDDRNRGVPERAYQTVPREEIFAKTGVQFMEINTLYQLIACREQTPELLDAADRLLMMPDFFHWCLCGSDVVEFTNATTSQCLDALNRDWASDLLSRFEIPTDIFPEIVSPGAQLGHLRPGVASRTGLAGVEVIAPATHDTGAAVVAVPTKNTGRANWAYISSGTWSLIGVEVADAILTPEALAANVTNEGGIDGTFRLLKNVMGLWLVQGCRRSFEKDGRSRSYERLVVEAEQAAEGGPLIDPDDTRFLNPADMTDAIRDYCRATGQVIPESEGEFVRVTLESLALKYSEVLRAIEGLTGERVEVIHVVGGGSRNALLNQFTADACGVPVHAGPVEATVLGNVLVQARAVGAVSSLAEIREVVRNSTTIRAFEPAADRDYWEQRRSLFTDLVARSV